MMEYFRLLTHDDTNLVVCMTSKVMLSVSEWGMTEPRDTQEMRDNYATAICYGDYACRHMSLLESASTAGSAREPT